MTDILNTVITALGPDKKLSKTNFTNEIRKARNKAVDSDDNATAELLQKVLKNVDRFDANGDGVITEDEVKAFAKNAGDQNKLEDDDFEAPISTPSKSQEETTPVKYQSAFDVKKDETKKLPGTTPGTGVPGPPPPPDTEQAIAAPRLSSGAERVKFGTWRDYTYRAVIFPLGISKSIEKEYKSGNLKRDWKGIKYGAGKVWDGVCGTFGWVCNQGWKD